MKHRRVVGSIAALATVAGGSALVAMASPSYAGSVSVGDFPTVSKDSVEVVKGSNGQVRGVIPKKSIEDTTGASSPTEAAKAHVKRLAPALGVNPSDLTAVKETQVPGGNVVRFNQKVDGLEVYAGAYIAALGDNNDLQALLGEGPTGKVKGLTKNLDQATGAQIAKDYVSKDEEAQGANLKVEFEGAKAYDASLLKPEALPVTRKVLQFHVYDHAKLVDREVLVDVGLKSVALSVDNVMHEMNRKVCDAGGQDIGSLDAGVCDGKALKYTREEGDDAVGNAEVDEVFDNFGTVTQWYANYANLDLTEFITNGDAPGGKALRASVDVCASEVQSDCPMANAFWLGGDYSQMYFGRGLGKLDITGHELTHGVTEYTAGLKGIYQSGALNEGLSDVQSELIDLAANPDKRESDAAWIQGDEYQPGGIRDMADPTASDPAQPDKMTSPNWDDDPDFTDAGGIHTNMGVLNKTAYLISNGDSFNGYDVRGLGLAKTFKLFWTAQNLLTPGADYKDMFTALELSCKKNVGRTGTFVTEDDCAQVSKAVRATEMYKDAAKGAPVAVPYCEDGGTVNRTYFEGFDREKGLTFKVGGTAGLALTHFGERYANSGKDSGLIWTGEGYDSGVLEQKAGVKVPKNGLLRVDYATEFGNNVSAQVEYDAGNGWQPAGELSGSENGGPWQGFSNGWASARFDLSSVAGETVKFRFSMQGQDPRGASIFFVDNMKVYNCG